MLLLCSAQVPVTSAPWAIAARWATEDEVGMSQQMQQSPLITARHTQPLLKKQQQAADLSGCDAGWWCSAPQGYIEHRAGATSYKHERGTSETQLPDTVYTLLPLIKEA